MRLQYCFNVRWVKGVQCVHQSVPIDLHDNDIFRNSLHFITATWRRHVAYVRLPACLTAARTISSSWAAPSGAHEHALLPDDCGRGRHACRQWTLPKKKRKKNQFRKRKETKKEDQINCQVRGFPNAQRQRGTTVLGCGAHAHERATGEETAASLTPTRPV